MDRLDRYDAVRVARDACARVLSCTGVHRLTEVVAEGWQVFYTVHYLDSCGPGFNPDEPRVNIRTLQLPPTFQDMSATAELRPDSRETLKSDLQYSIDFLAALHEAARQVKLKRAASWFLDLRVVLMQAYDTVPVPKS